MKRNKIILIGFIVVSILLISWSIYHKPHNYGDGQEYFAMTTSLGTHGTPNLLTSDIEERRMFFDENKTNTGDPYSGYFKDNQGKWYSYHFWFYSLLNLPVYWVVKVVQGNLMATFQITNIMLMLLSLGWLLFRSRIGEKEKIFFTIGWLCSPIWLYVPWPHPEVFSFTFLFIGLIEFMDNRKKGACLWTGMSSFQNPAISLVTAYIGINELIKERRINKNVILTGLSSTIVLFPFLWTWVHYHRFSIISDVATGKMSIDKSLNLFFDPNMGLFIYVPVLFISLLWLILKRNRVVLMWSIVLLFISFICSVQLNWNSGLMYINRYAVWLIPVLLIAILPLVLLLNKKQFIAYMTAFCLTSGSITTYCIVQYDTTNHVKFSPLAKWILANVPSIYNPPFDVFAKRALGAEVNTADSLPVIIANEHGAKKVLAGDNTSGLIGYIDGPSSLLQSGENLGSIKYFEPGHDIFSTALKASFVEGYHALEKWDFGNVRWTTDKSKLLFSASNGHKNSKLSFKIGSYKKPRELKMILNGKPVNLNNNKIGDATTIVVETELNSFNILEIQSLEKRVTTDENEDPRRLAFYIFDMKVE